MHARKYACAQEDCAAEPHRPGPLLPDLYICMHPFLYRVGIYIDVTTVGRVADQLQHVKSSAH
jgi:hypothetical protein